MILGLFPELQASGGVQRAGRHIAAVLAEYATERGMAYRFLSLNDPAGVHRGSVGRREFSSLGFGRRRGRFVYAALCAALHRPRLVVAAHPHLALAARATKALATTARIAVVAYGVDVWTALPVTRKWALGRADLVLAISSDTARRLVAVQGVPEMRVRCLPLGLDPEFTLALTRRTPPEQHLHTFPDGRIVLTVSRQVTTERYKGIDLLIQAVRGLLPTVPDLYLIVIGDGTDRPRLEYLARELGVGDHVRFLGVVSAETLVAAYQRCDVFALPSGGEGFGLVFVEAMAFGKPVVAGAHGGTTDIIEDGVTGWLVSHGDVGRLTSVLGRLLLDDNLRREVGRRAQERVRSSYLFDHFRMRLMDILDETCAA
jgi:glycosyltransferase involved in cell wall biosynthesis